MNTRPELDKTFDPASFEMRWYRAQEEAGFFRPEAAGPDAVPYSLVIPPPNVTGRLHVGHALGRTLEDVLCRWRRMQGRAVLWVCLLYTSPSPRDRTRSRMPSSA